VTQKFEIIRQLGEQALLVPVLLSEALAANDRLKLRLTLLQEAANHVRRPGCAAHAHEAERRAAGLADPAYDATIAGARALSDDRIRVPGARPLLAGIAADLATMLAPLQAFDAGSWRPLGDRLGRLADRIPAGDNDEIALDDVDALTSARRGRADSVHLLVMDAHKAINRLAAETAVETIDGARVHHIDDTDRLRIRAFMTGLNRTAVLAFGHPGLGTTATRVGARLIIQNDIGATDAHVLVIHVDGNAVTLTYTDVHRVRARFFMSLFEGHEIAWSPLGEHSGIGGQDVFYLVVGHLVADQEGALLRVLELLGSRIVFLIDWNKARKALQTFVGKSAALELLTDAAMHDYGHRAFLELGGVDLVFEAIRRTAAGRIPYGARLDETLGASESANFLRRVLRQTSEGLRAGRSVRLIRDEVQAELAQLLDTAEFAVLTVLVRHLGLARMLAAAIAETFAGERAGLGSDRKKLAQSAKRIEEKADRLTLVARDICARVQRADNLRQVVDQVEDATDALDECAFMLSLLPGETNNLATLQELAAITIESISALVRATEAASRLPESHRSDAADSLQSIDAVVMAEHRADAAVRDAFSALMSVPHGDARVLVRGLQVAGALEIATDHLAHAALSLRERVLEELSA
jgi:uncharacterized protein Yka (UPF0111/DUF47 family)